MNDIKKYLEKELNCFETSFNSALKSKIPLLDRILKYVIKSKGKQIRPMFVLLSSAIFGEINDKTYRAASLIELLHTATLVHDDVVDDADKRRSFFSINAIWKNKIAVLVGDYLLSKGLLLSIKNKDFEILEILSEAVSDMSEGELLQIEKARKLDIDESIYFDIIKRKTASLISSSFAAGAFAATQNVTIANQMKIIGEKVGIAFQIKDDLFDYGKAKIGKPTGNDIKEKKMTLPLIYTLKNCDKPTRTKIKYIFKNREKKANEISYIIDKVIEHGGIEYAENQMNLYYNEALQLIEELPDNEARTHFKNLVNFTIKRKY